MSGKQWFHRRYDERTGRAAACQVGVAIVAASIIGMFLEPSRSAWAPILIAVGLFCLHIGIGKIQEDE